MSRAQGARRAAATAMLLLAVATSPAPAVERPHGLDDIALGASYVRLAAVLDFRDVHAAIAAQRDGRAGKPDFGRRGYGCARREDARADVACVSHDERVDGSETREIRLHFLGGILQQFSVTAEIRHFDALLQALRRRHGEPQQGDAPEDGYPAVRWRNAQSTITAWGGRDLVFVSFELAAYPEWVRRKQAGHRALECR